jgi:CheY-like chemotaxis protein
MQSPGPATDHIHLLLVDDDDDDHVFFKEAAQKFRRPLKVTSLYDGSQVLEYLFKMGVYKDNTDPFPDLLVLDINMPVMSGETVLKTLKAIKDFQKLPVYVLTTARDERTRRFCENLSASGVYTKTSSMADMKVLVEDMLNSI